MGIVDNLSKGGIGKDTFSIILEFLDFRDHYALFMTARKYRTWTWEYRYRKFQRQIDNIKYFKETLIGQKMAFPNGWEPSKKFPFKGDIIRLATDYSFWWQAVPGWKLGNLWQADTYGYIYNVFKILESNLQISQLSLRSNTASWREEWYGLVDRIFNMINLLNDYGGANKEVYSGSLLGKIYVNPFDDFCKNNIKFSLSIQSFKFGEKRPKFTTFRCVPSGIYLVKEDREIKLLIQDFNKLCLEFDVNYLEMLIILKILGNGMIIRENNPFKEFFSDDFYGPSESDAESEAEVLDSVDTLEAEFDDEWQ